MGLYDTFIWLFLPRDFPSSVSADYVPYQLWDTLQGFLGYLKGIILTFSFLKGLGVGNQDGSIQAAMVITIMRDSTGVVSGLLVGMPTFTKYFEDPNQFKKWRLISEFIRIVAGFIELYAVLCSHFVFMVLVCTATTLNTAAGVMGNLTRASLITHFAVKDNISDCAAKEGNQDRGVKIFGIPLAFCFLSILGDNPYFAFYSYIFVVICQFLCNVLAVRALQIKDL